MTTRVYRSEWVVCACLVLSACGGGGGSGSSDPPPSSQMFSVGGTVSGLDAVGLVLQNNGGPDLAISTNGSFSFPAQLASGSAYAVTIRTQPNIGPLQVCSLTNHSGTVTNSAITNVGVSCVSRSFKFLYVTSATVNELRGYSINTTDGSLAALPGPPISTGLGPALPIPDPAGRFLYLPTRGSFVDSPRVSVYAADAVSGTLTEIANSPYDLSTPPPPPGAFAVLPPAIHRSGAFGYLPVVTPASMLYGATIDATTGGLTAIPGMPIDLGTAMSGIAYDSTGNFLFAATNASNGSGEIRTFLVNSPSGVLTPIGSFPTYGNTPVGAFLTAGDDYLLTTNVNSGTLTVFAVNKTAGTLTPLASAVPTGPAGSRPVGITFNRRSNVFYITHIPSGPTTVAAFRFDPATGLVTPVGAPLATNGAGSGVFLHPSGRFLFQFNSVTGAIQRFAIDQATGSLAAVPDVTPLSGATQAAMVLDVSGKFLFVTNTSAATVSSYSINSTSGALTPINTVPTSPGAFSTLPFRLQ